MTISLKKPPGKFENFNPPPGIQNNLFLALKKVYPWKTRVDEPYTLNSSLEIFIMLDSLWKNYEVVDRLLKFPLPLEIFLTRRLTTGKPGHQSGRSSHSKPPSGISYHSCYPWKSFLQDSSPPGKPELLRWTNFTHRTHSGILYKSCYPLEIFKRPLTPWKIWRNWPN